jgi:type VI secretion system secreted protein Hcp
MHGVKGDATEEHHKHWIRLNSLEFNSGHEVDTTTGQVEDRIAGTGFVNEILASKDMDSASAHLFKSTCKGEGETVEIHVTRTGSTHDKSEVVYLKYHLHHALLTHYSLSAADKDSYGELIKINFTKIEMSYTPQDEAIKGVSPQLVSFDMAKVDGQGH